MTAMAQYPPGMNMQPGFAHGHPGMAPGPNQHMGPQIQMHPGMSGPPQVSQASAMMGMQPGANGMAVAGMGGQHPGAGMAMPGQNMGGPQANMQATLAQQQFMQHQHQLMQNNPQALLQMQQHRQQQIALRAQQLGMSTQQLQSMNQTQMNHFMNQANFMNNAAGHQQPAGVGGVGLPDHLRQQQMQVNMRAQQSQVQQNMLAQQAAAMQHATSQHSNQSQPAAQHPQGQPGQPGPQGQPGHPGQIRPQSRMANPNDQAQQQQMQQHQGPPQQNQQQPQHQPTPPQANAQQGQQGMTPQQQQHLQQQQAQQAQMQQSQMAQRNFVLQRKLQLEAQRTTAAAQQSQMQQHQQAQQHLAGGQYILRLLLFADKLGSFSATDGEQDGRDLERWQRFIDGQFAEDGRLVLQLYDQPTKPYEIPRAVLGRFFWMFFETSASSLRLHTENAKEVKLQDGSGRCRLSCSNATLSVSYTNGARIDLSGPLVVMFGPGMSQIEAMEFKMDRCDEHMSRTEVEKVLLNLSPTMANQKSPKLAKNKLPKAQQKLQQQQQGEGLTIESFPKAPKSQSGVSLRMLQFLEISETMNMMQDLVSFAAEQRLPATTALDQLNAKYDASPLPPQPPQLPPHLLPNGATPQMRTLPNPPPGFSSSPALNHMQLPNGITSSPHMGQNLGLPPQSGGQGMSMSSPNSGVMAAPPMVLQHSQQGTNSSAASANTSPMVSNKRRRSQVKMEEEGGGGGEGKVKPSPRMGKKGKPS